MGRDPRDHRRQRVDKSNLIKALSGALVPDEGEICWTASRSTSGPDGRPGGPIGTVYQTLAVAPGLDIVDNLLLNRDRASPVTATTRYERTVASLLTDTCLRSATVRRASVARVNPQPVQQDQWWPRPGPVIGDT
jgi:ABC-type sugar transport system ATPase subunit